MTSEGIYEKTTNVDTISEYSQLTNPSLALKADAFLGSKTCKAVESSKAATDVNELVPAIFEPVSSSLIYETPPKNTYNNIFGNHSTASRRTTTDHHGVIVAGHRGGSKGHEPENTMRAFRKAIDMGV